VPEVVSPTFAVVSWWFCILGTATSGSYGCDRGSWL